MQNTNHKISQTEPVNDLSKRAKASYRRGEKLKKEGLLTQSSAAYKKAIEIKPDYIKALICLGKIYQKQKKWHEAARYYRQVVNLQPHRYGIYIKLAQVLKRQNKIYDAIAAYAEAIKLKSDLPAKIYRNYEDLLREVNGNNPDAIVLTKKTKAAQKTSTTPFDERNFSLYSSHSITESIQEKYNNEKKIDRNSKELAIIDNSKINAKSSSKSKSISNDRKSSITEREEQLKTTKLINKFITKGEYESGLNYIQKLIELKPAQIYNIELIEVLLNLLARIEGKNFINSVENKWTQNNNDAILESLSFVYSKCDCENTVHKELIAVLERIILSSVFFTIDVGKKGGVTDQLMQFFTYYKLGRIVGMNYIHKDFYSVRSSDAVYDFLGFNSYWEERLENSLCDRENIKEFLLELSIDLLEKKEIYSLPELISYVQKIALEQFSYRKKLLLVFPRISDARAKLCRIINGAIPYLPDGVNLRDLYLKHRNADSLNTRNIVKAVVHIRLGDVASIKTPWNSFICVRSSQVKETNRLPSGRIEVDNFYDVVHLLQKKLASLKVNFNLFSDGYGMAFKIALNNAKLPLKKLNALKALQTSYENAKFIQFDSLNFENKYIGEDDDSLFKLIDYALNSQIIITSVNQRMMPKLISCFPNESNKQIVIILSNYNELNSKSLIEIGLSSEKAHVFNINVTNDLELQIEPVTKLIKQKFGV